MDKIIKFLRKLTPKENIAIEAILHDVKNNRLSQYNVKKLSGHMDIYRIRVGKIRIIFKNLESKIDILDISRRSEKTYRDY